MSMKTKEENLFQTYLSKIINSAFESGLVEREKRFKPEIISKDLLDIINHIKTKTREETIREVGERESIKLVHEKAFNCPTLSIQCNHDFKFSHTEEENKIGSVGTTAGTMPPRLFDVVVCSKCGEIIKSLKYLTN